MTPAELNALLQEHECCVRSAVAEFLRRLPRQDPIFDRDDLYAWGMIGLWQATRSFEPSKGVAFRTHAFWKIRGAIKDGLRTSGRVKRGLRRLVAAGQRRPPKWEPLADCTDHREPSAGRRLQDEDARRLLARYVGKRCQPILHAILAGEPRKTAAVALGVSAERVSQLFHDLLDRLKESSLKDRLEEFTHA